MEILEIIKENYLYVVILLILFFPWIEMYTYQIWINNIFYLVLSFLGYLIFITICLLILIMFKIQIEKKIKKE